MNQIIKIRDLVRSGDDERIFPKRNTENCSDKTHAQTQIKGDTIPNYGIKNLSKRFN